MATLKTTLLTSLAALCAAAGSPQVSADYAEVLLRTAQSAANQLSPCPASADDVVGATALRILRSHGDVLEREGAQRAGYIKKSVRNALRDELRRRRRMQPLADLEPGAEALLERSGGAEEGVGAAVVAEFRDSLPPADREVLALLEEGCVDRGIAERLNRTRHDVRGSVERIRRSAEQYFG